MLGIELLTNLDAFKITADYFFISLKFETFIKDSINFLRIPFDRIDPLLR